MASSKNIFVYIGKPVYIIISFFVSSVFKIISVFIHKIWLILLLGSAIGIGWGAKSFYTEIVTTLPSIEQIETLPPMSSKIMDREGKLLYKFYKDENRSWLPLNKIPQFLIWATIAVEDKEFYSHSGFSARGILRSIEYNIKNKGELRGGSTITQQLVKNVFLNNEKTWKRKIKEVILAVLVEWKLDKNQILEKYFNQVSYGGEAYGVEEASLKYFGKNVWEINSAEATFLAGLPAAPSLYSPYDDFEKARLRQKQVLVEMIKAGFINQETGQKILSKPIKLAENQITIKYPHFVFYVKDYVENKLGYTEIEKKGLTIKTTIDENIQDESTRIVEEEVGKLGNLLISNGAAVVIDPKTGEVLAMVGSKNYWATDIDGKFNVTLSPRQPGSAIKPINYSLALIRGKTLLSMVEDSPVVYKIAGQKDYIPKNYNGKYAGKVTIKQALASSLNIPSVKILNENGVAKMIELGQKMGITTWEDKDRFGLSLALGAGEVKMIDLASAYTTFANLGDRVEINPVLEMTDYMGEIIYTKEVKKERVIPSEVAFLINEALSDDVARRLVFSPGSLLNISGKKVAVKTGTTNNLRDNWCIGWTPSYLVASWVGNNDNRPMSWVASGISGATPIWHKIMSAVLEGRENETWDVPSGIQKVNVCGKEEYVISGQELSTECFWLTPSPSNELIETN